MSGARTRRSTALVGWGLGVAGGTAALFLGGLSRPLGGATGGIAVLLRHRPGVALGAVTAVLVARGVAGVAPARVPAGPPAAAGLAVGALVAAVVPPVPHPAHRTR